MRRSALLFSFSGALLALTGCGHKGVGQSGSLIEPGAERLATGLYAFSSCDATLDYFKKEATVAMETELEADKRWYDGCAVPEAAGATGNASAGAAPSAAPNHSTTNNQVVGVDEADILKTYTVGGALYNAYVAQPDWSAAVLNSNGTYTYNPNGTLVISQVYPIANGAVVSRVTLSGTPTAMLVAYPYAVVFTSTVAGAFGTPSHPVNTYYDYGSAVKTTVFDIHDPNSPTVVRERWNEGQYLSARMVGQSVRLVTNYGLGGPPLQMFPTDPNLNFCNPDAAQTAAINQAYDALIAQNKQLIANSTLADWIPHYSDTLQGATVGTAQTFSCGQLMRPGDPVGTQTTQITTLSLTSDATARAPFDDVAIVAEGDVVYASTTGLYVATNPYDASYWATYDALWQSAQNGNNATNWVDFPIEQTTVHRFDTSDPLHTSYFSSNTVQGSLINQFSMDEQNTTLRVASTTRRFAVLEQSAKSNNLVTTLDTQHTGLPQVGVLTDIEVGEHITAVRFAGLQVFMSTMHEVDPFLVIDLSDASQPALRGTLPVPGDATYLQTLDANHVLAIGYSDVGAANWGWLSGVQLSIYDVTQPGSPKLAQNTTLQGGYVYSEALYDHHALTYFTTEVNGEPVNLLAFPVNVYSNDAACVTYGCYEGGLRVYKVDYAQGFTYLGDVYHNSFATQTSWGYESVERSMILGPDSSGKTYIVSVSDLGEKITDLAAFAGQTTEVPSVSVLPY